MTTKPATNECYQAVPTPIIPDEGDRMSYEHAQRWIGYRIMQYITSECQSEIYAVIDWRLFGVFGVFDWFHRVYPVNSSKPIIQCVQEFREHMNAAIEDYTDKHRGVIGSAAFAEDFKARFEKYLGAESYQLATKIQEMAQKCGHKATIGTMHRENVVYFVFIEIEDKLFAGIRAATDTRDISQLCRNLENHVGVIGQGSGLFKEYLRQQAKTDGKSMIYDSQ